MHDIRQAPYNTQISNYNKFYKFGIKKIAMRKNLYNNKVSIFLLILIFASAFTFKLSAQTDAGKKMKLVWRDEFNKK